MAIPKNDNFNEPNIAAAEQTKRQMDIMQGSSLSGQPVPTADNMTGFMQVLADRRAAAGGLQNQQATQSNFTVNQPPPQNTATPEQIAAYTQQGPTQTAEPIPRGANIPQQYEKFGNGVTNFSRPISGATIPQGQQQAQGTFKPVTFRSGTGTSTSNAGGMTTELNDPYSGLAGLVGQGTGLLGTAANQAQQAPDKFNYNFNPEQASQDLFNQRSALLQPAFAQQNTQAQEAMFGSGRLGLRLAGEGLGAGAGSGMMSPDAFGVNQAQSQALAGLAAQSTTDAFGQEMQRAGLDSNQFNVNQAGQQQQYSNLVNSGQGMLSAGMQGAGLEQDMAQQQLQNQQLSQDYNLAQQNYNLASQGQTFNQGLSNQQLALDAQGQQQNYGLNQQNYNLASQGQQQNYGLAQQQQMQDYGFGMQNYGLAQQQQLQDYGFGMQDYGLNQGQLALAQQQQQQDYGFGQQDYGLQRDALAQNYEMGTEQNAISRMTGQAQANNYNYQPDPWLTAGVGLGTAYLGSDAGSNWLSNVGEGWEWPF